MTKTEIQTLCAGSLTEDMALTIAATRFWEQPDWGEIELFTLQVNQLLLVMDWSVFRRATEKALGRPVWTHEYGDYESLWLEYKKEKPNPIDECGSQEVHVLRSFYRAVDRARAKKKERHAHHIQTGR